MAKAKAQQDEDVAVDQYGRPLPLVVMVDKAGNEVPIRDAGSLTNAHYGEGMTFAEEGQTYAQALSHILGDTVDQHLVQVSSDEAADESAASKHTSKSDSKSD